METTDYVSTTRTQHARDAITALTALIPATLPPASRRAVADIRAFQGTALPSTGFGRGTGMSDGDARVRTAALTDPKLSFVPDVDPFRTRIPPV